MADTKQIRNGSISFGALLFYTSSVKTHRFMYIGPHLNFSTSVSNHMLLLKALSVFFCNYPSDIVQETNQKPKGLLSPCLIRTASLSTLEVLNEDHITSDV